jgi:hypothetical protein
VNAPLDTPEWLNTVDADPPISGVSLVDAAACDSADLTVHWSGTDTGSGIESYTVFVAENGGPARPFLVATTDTSAPFTGQPGRTYAFYSVARDAAGNVEAAPATADVVHKVGCPSRVPRPGQPGALATATATARLPSTNSLHS